MKQYLGIPPRRLHILLLLVLLFAALILRLIRLDFQPLWWDEGYSVWFAGQPLVEMLRLTAEDIHPPLYYGLLHIWATLWGLAPVPLRLFSLFVSLLAIPLAYVLGRDLDDRSTGLIAAAIVVINPLAIYYSQEIRMYGLATSFSLAALWAGWRWMQPQAKSRFGIVYTLSLAGGLYTLYYFALLPLAQTVWVLLFNRKRLIPWLVSQAAAVLLFLPWMLFAGPKLLDYVAYKIVKDNDTPLSILPYIGRHLSAFLTGHLEGPLAPLWPWALLILIPLIVVLVWPERMDADHPVPDRADRPRFRPLTYLAVCLFIPLAVGFVQQLRAPFIPDRFERVLLFAAPAFWLLLALGLRRLAREVLPAAVLVGGLLVIANVASLGALYTTPRYTQADYRPLIETVLQNSETNDSVFTIFPWQTGYFWAYLPDNATLPIVASKDLSWGSEVQEQLDDLLGKGAVWFPEHLALGGILEFSAEDYLAEHTYQVLNRWYGEETRLTAWTKPTATSGRRELTTPIAWQNGVILESAALMPADESSRILIDLGWSGTEIIQPADLSYSLWLAGPGGYRWAQRDVSPFAHPWPPLESDQHPWTNQDRIALTLPAGTPPGEYDIWIALLDPSLTPVALQGSNPAPQAWLGTLAVPSGGISAKRITVSDHPQTILGQDIDFLGYDRVLLPQLPGEDMAVSLYWSLTAPLDADLFLFLQLLDENRQVVAGTEGPPLGWLPTSTWPTDKPLRSQHKLRIPADLQAGSYQLITGLFEPVSGERKLWDGADHLNLGDVSVGTRVHNYEPLAPQVPLNLQIEGGHRLIGYDLVAGDSPGSPINLVLYWAPAGPTDLRYSTFVHLLDPDDTILDQSDNEPAQGEAPTTAWLPGEYVSDPHTLTLPPDTSPGLNRLMIGLYHPPTGQRLHFVDEEGTFVSDHIILPLN